MPMSKAGKHFMNPIHAKAADAAAGGPPKDTAPASTPDMSTDPDAGSQMITCPSCGAQFPEELGMTQPDAVAQPQPQSSGSPAGMSGY